MTQGALKLAGVTLCCVDTRSPDLALGALKICMSHAEFEKAILIGPAGWRDAENLPREIQFVGIKPFEDIDAYSRFILKQLGGYIDTSHVLVIQWDGYVLHPELWQPTFLNYDYIGSPWYHGGHPGSVGNGGFSLRSKRLLNALEQMDIPDAPEDVAICVHLRPHLERDFGIRLAPLEVAQRFACEYGEWKEAFGFHGLHNFAHFMDEVELKAWLQTAPPYILSSQHARKLVKELMRSGKEKLARDLIRQRSEITGWNLDLWMLTIRSTWFQLRQFIHRL